MKFLIVTPSFNRVEYLDDTIRSVVSQKGDFEIEYIIQDASDDPATIKLLKDWKQRERAGELETRCRKLSLKIFFEKDQGMYDAINRGFAAGTGDIMAWINSDDMYYPGAFQAVAQVFDRFREVGWITGIPNSFNAFGSSVGFDSWPPVYSRKFIRQGYYDVANHRSGFNWIPQDCLFWRSSLWEKAGGSLNPKYKQAADFHLWQKFAGITDLVKVYAFLGGYRFHGEQFTANPENYRAELPKRPRLPRGYLFLRWLFGVFPSWKRSVLRRTWFLRLLRLRRPWLMGRLIKWHPTRQEWILQQRTIL